MSLTSLVTRHLRQSLLFALASVGLLCAVPALADDEAVTNFPPFGIIITNCVRDTRGTWVEFVSDQEPPYYVGLYPSYDFAEGGYIKEAVVSGRSAFLSGDYTYLPVLVKVLTASRIAEVNGDGFALHRRLTDAEIESYAATCRAQPVPDTTVSIKRIFGSGPFPILYACSISIPRYFSITYDGMTYTNSTTKAATVNFKETPVPSALPGEENIYYWTQSTITESPYDPSTHNNWCLWSDGHYWPEYIMYKNGPVLALVPESATTNEEMYAGSMVPVIRYEVPCTSLQLDRGEILSGASIALPTFSHSGTPNYYTVPVTNTSKRVEYNKGWNLHPMYNPEPGREMHWQEMNNRTNCSQAVYLPREIKSVPSDNSVRVTTDWFGQAIMVTNTPNHWATDFGIVDIPPGSNSLFRVSIVPLQSE